MGVKNGTGGGISIPDTSGASLVAMTINNWTANLPKPQSDTTGFKPDNNLRTSISGNRATTGTFTGFLDDTLIFNEADYVNENPAAVLIVLEYNRTAPTGPDTIQRATFLGYLTNFSAGVEPGVPNSVSGSFVGTGQVTFETASSP